MSQGGRFALQQIAGMLLGTSCRSSSAWQNVRKFSSAGAASGQTAALIKQLRERSGAPIADVKSMLIANDWDMDKAYEALRKKGLAAAAKKASRHAAEGLIGAAFAASTSRTSDPSTSASTSAGSGGAGSVVVVELNSETDFVARNSLFQGLLREIMTAGHSLGPSAVTGPSHELDMDQLLQARTSSGVSVSEAVTQVAAQVRENVRLRRAYRVDSRDGLVYTYVHQAATPGLGRLASVVVLRTAGRSVLAEALADSSVAPVLKATGEGLAMHVAGMRPAYLHRAAVPGDVLEKERALLVQQLVQDDAFRNKPAQVLSKVVEGRLSKQLAEWCLAEQRYVLDEEVTVEKLLARVHRETGWQLQVESFLRVKCGEGLEPKAGTDFASEVARIVSGEM